MKISWEPIKNASTAISIVVVPILLAYLGNSYTKALKEREIEAQFVKIAVDVLQAPPSGANRNVREWATKVIDKYSGVPLGDKAKEDLIEKVPISSATPTPSVINVRKGPGSEYPIVTTVTKGKSLKVLQVSGEWCEILTDTGVKGWVSKRFIEADLENGQK